MVLASGHVPWNEPAIAAKSGPHATQRRFLPVIFTIVITWFALRYVVEIKISISWRAPVLQQQYGTAKHCKNTCFKARDGVCDEGRPHRDPLQQQYQQELQKQQGMPAGVSAVHCDLGTDCSDCGPWSGQQADDTWSEDHLPIEFLRLQNISVRARLTSAAAAPINITFAFTDPATDWDVSGHIQHQGLLEIGISQVFYTVLFNRCSGSGPGGVVADVGGNFGWFSLLAAKLGCRVIAWEPVPQFLAFFSYNLARNHLTHMVEVRPTVVADPPGSKQVVVVPNRGIWGTAGISGINIDEHIHDASRGAPQQVEVIAESLDDVLSGKHIDLLKVDVEGFEPSVLATAKTLTATGAIENIVLEYSPGVYERASRWTETRIFPRMLANLLQANFTLLHLDDEFTRVWSDGRSVSSALPLLREVTATNLQYDFWESEVFRTGWLEPGVTKPFCLAMQALHLDNQGIPERLHPKSFHSMFGHNTNVWASRDSKVLAGVIGVPVGVFPLDYSINSSWFPPPGYADSLGGIACPILAEEMARDLSKKSARDIEIMMTVLIGRRCRCSHNLPCKQYEAAAETCAKAGQTPYVDL